MKNKPSPPFTFFTGIVPSCSFINKSFVFLGTGECGKSSFARQLISNQVVVDKNLKIHSEHIQYSVLQNLVNITTNAQVRRNITGDDENIVKQLAHLVENYVDSHFERRHLEVLLKNCKNFIKLLKNPAVCDVIDNPELYPLLHLAGNHQYFFKNSERILLSNNYEPTIEDLARLQKKTVGIVNCGSTEFKNFKLTITDTGGQRNERKKWKHVISANPLPDAIFFMVSLSECFQYCYEDQNENRNHSQTKSCLFLSLSRICEKLRTSQSSEGFSHE
ncbi:predicted protein [Naegleria gruberi]|uniref:Predicted protein n=1 Tax=Naegleria gruberi TaxID=5762 RepID=D2VSM9_NAEGR|nr:uncharacterized protein NAEGRDRAFT_71997 [Naegleria gruberi]EFC40218.1 predicted protein [Naegleria gruberi]|eukprot:XP_002672962.1 predicted protein [Naegleria gruberi strain NEG-M]